MKNFPLFLSHTWKYNIQARERLTKVKEKWSTIQLDVFVVSFIFFAPMSQTKSVINRSGVCYALYAPDIKIVAGVLACARVITRIKLSRLHVKSAPNRRQAS